MSEPIYNHDAHVRDYYDLRDIGIHGKFEGERLAVEKAYLRSLDGFIHDDFGSVDEGGYYCRVLFEECPFIVCFVEDSQGFIKEVDCHEYESIWAQWIEDNENSNDLDE